MGIFTTLSKTEIKDVLTNFSGLPDQDFRAEGVEIGTVNTFYRITFADKKSSVYYLKIDEIADEKRLKNEIQIFQLLAKHQRKLSYQIPLPLKTNTNKFYLKSNKRFYLIFRAIPGRSLYSELKPSHLKIMGQKLAELHKLAVTNSIKPHRFCFAGLKQAFNGIKPKITQKHPQIATLITRELTAIQKQLGASQKSVLIHADLFPENVLWIKNDFSGMLDFEAGGLGDALFDIGVSVHALCLNDANELDSKKLKAFLQGYQSIRKITNADFKRLPAHLKLTCLRFLITRLKDFELRNANPKDANFKDYQVYLKRYGKIDDIITQIQA